MANVIGHPASTFVRESVAMFFDATWWGLPNRAWVRHYLDAGTYVAPSQLLQDAVFDGLDCAITYPIAGAWAEMLVHRFGPTALRSFYASANLDPRAAFARTFSTSLEEFDAYLRRHAHDVAYGRAITDAIASA